MLPLLPPAYSLQAVKMSLVINSLGCIISDPSKQLGKQVRQLAQSIYKVRHQQKVKCTQDSWDNECVVAGGPGGTSHVSAHDCTRRYSP